MKPKAITVLSGGLDSTVATSIYANDYDITAITFNYGQQSIKQELKHAKMICEKLDMKHIVIDLPWLKEISNSSLTTDKSIPQPSDNDLDDYDKSIETAKSVSDLIQTYEWFKTHKLDYKILPVQPRGFAEDQFDLILDIPEYIEKLMELYHYWLTDKDCNIRFYTLEEFAHLRENSEFKPLWFDRKLSLNADGKIYPFGRPYDVNFCLGDPSSVVSIDDCFKSDSYNELKQILKDKIIKTCNTCEAFSICRGSCLCSSFVYGNSSDMLEYSCKLAEKTFMNVVKINNEVIKDIEEGNTDKYNPRALKIFS